MLYPDEQQPTDNSSTAIVAPSGSITPVQQAAQTLFRPWQPTTWPAAPQSFDPGFYDTVKTIFTETIIREIDNVIKDIIASNKTGLQHRGHVIAIVLLCAVDTIASYAYRNITGKGKIGKRYKKFIQNHFPPAYQPFANDIYRLHRNSAVHSWNLFEAAILPGNENVDNSKGTISFGLLNFFDALNDGLTDFLDKLETDGDLQASVLKRYEELKATAK